MAEFLYSTDEARKIIADHGYIARVSANGAGLMVYEGDEHAPGTWMEIGRLALRNGNVPSRSLQEFCA